MIDAAVLADMRRGGCIAACDVADVRVMEEYQDGAPSRAANS